MNESIQTDLVQTVLGEDKSVSLLLRFSAGLTAPKLKLIEQIVESVVTKLIVGDHLETHSV